MVKGGVFFNRFTSDNGKKTVIEVILGVIIGQPGGGHFERFIVDKYFLTIYTD